VIGIGIDEDTAIVVAADCLDVIGSGGVWILDGERAGHSNVSDGTSDETLSIANVLLHVFGAGRRYDLVARRPA
jgi:cyanophycinase